jgi:hypothetical protein
VIGAKIADLSSINLPSPYPRIALQLPYCVCRNIVLDYRNMSHRPKRAPKPTHKLQEHLMVSSAQQSANVVSRGAPSVSRIPASTEEVVVEKYPVVSTDQKVRVCEAQVKIHDFKERWHAKITRLEVIPNKKQVQKPLSADEATLWDRFAQEAHLAWSLFSRKDADSAILLAPFSLILIIRAHLRTHFSALLRH